MTAIFIVSGLLIFWGIAIRFMRGASVPAPEPPHVTTETDWWIATAKAAHKRRHA